MSGSLLLCPLSLSPLFVTLQIDQPPFKNPSDAESVNNPDNLLSDYYIYSQCYNTNLLQLTKNYLVMSLTPLYFVLNTVYKDNTFLNTSVRLVHYSFSNKLPCFFQSLLISHVFYISDDYLCSPLDSFHLSCNTESRYCTTQSLIISQQSRWVALPVSETVFLFIFP